METYALNVGGSERRGISSHAHNHSLVSGVAEWSALVSAESSQVAGSISQASKEPKNNADNRRESIGRDFEDKIQLT